MESITATTDMLSAAVRILPLSTGGVVLHRKTVMPLTTRCISDQEAENIQGVQMQSEIKVGQRFKFSILSDNPAPERQAVVTSVLSNREEGLGPEVDFYFAYWVEAYELPKTEVPTTLVFERGIDGNVYLDGRQVSITLLT
jgi:hypothetical protein